MPITEDTHVPSQTARSTRAASNFGLPQLSPAAGDLYEKIDNSSFALHTPDFSRQDTYNSNDTKARILAQQREVMLRRRQESMRAEAVRPIEDPTFNLSASSLRYHTPSITPFSMPSSENNDVDGGNVDANSAKQFKRVVPMPQGPAPSSAARRLHAYRANISSSSSFEIRKLSPSPKFSEEVSMGRQDGDTSGSDGEEESPATLEHHTALSSANKIPVYKAPIVTEEVDFPSLLATRAGLLSFLTRPVARSTGVVECYIKRRNMGAGKLFPEYYLYTRNGDHFLMAAKKQGNKRTSNYHVTMHNRDFAKDSPDYLGKVRANFVGTEFQLFDRGGSSKEKPTDGAASFRDIGASCEELGVVVYAANVLGARGPRKMQVYLPRVNMVDDRVEEWKGKEDMALPDAMLERVRRGDISEFHHFINKPPRWNDQVKAYVLNFNGRVTMASVKNFQLVAPKDHETVLLQFGRVDKHEFTMDVRWPFTPLQAFGVALSSFDSKIACD